MGKTPVAKPVEVVNEEPLAVTLEQPAPPTPIKTPEGNLSLPPTTTEQEDRVTQGQRHINRVWEYSQAAIALMITGAIVYTSIMGISSDNLSNGFFLIIGFYFSRVNHQAIGGTGRKPEEYPYQGR